MTFREFKDDQKQFLGLEIWCKNNEDGSHSEKNVLMVLEKLRHHAKIENGSSVSNSKKNNYISTTIKCYEHEVAEMVVLVRKFPEVLKMKVEKHLSWIELQALVKELNQKNKLSSCEDCYYNPQCKICETCLKHCHCQVPKGEAG